MTSPGLSHPSCELLQQLSAGLVNGHEANALEKHLVDCPVCCQSLQQFAPDR
jgi:hypothetical protein